MKVSRAIAVIAAITVAVLTLGVVSVVDAEPASAPSAPTIETIVESTTTTTLEVDLSFLNSTTTTSTIVQEPAGNDISNVPVPEYRNDHADRWDQLAQCETGGNWATNTGNGFGGGLQFMHGSGYSTWLSFGGGEFAANPWDATREQQIVIAERVLAGSGWGAWPGCSRKFGWL